MHKTVELQTAALRNFCAIINEQVMKSYCVVKLTLEEGDFIFTLQKSTALEQTNLLIIDSTVAKCLNVSSLNTLVRCKFMREDDFLVVKYARIKPNTFNDYCLMAENFDLIQRVFVSQITHCQLKQPYIIWISKSIRVHFTFESIDDGLPQGRLFENSLIEIIPVQMKNHSRMENNTFSVNICPDNYTKLSCSSITVPHLDDKMLHEIPVGILMDDSEAEQIVYVAESVAIKHALFNGCKIVINASLDSISRIPRFQHQNVNFNSKEITNLLDSFRSIVVLGCSGSGKTTILKDLFYSSKCIFLDTLESILNSYSNIENAIFLLDNCCDAYQENPQLFEWNLKTIFKLLLRRKFKLVISWNDSSVKLCSIVKYLFDHIFQVKNLPLAELISLCNNDFDLVQQLENKPISIVKRQIKYHGMILINSHFPIVGYSKVKEILLETIVWPIQYKRLYIENGLKCKGCVLLYGPSGCGKSTIAYNFIVSLVPNIHVIKVKGPELLGKYIGSSEESIRQVFSEARQRSPSLIVFDEFDSLAGVRGTDHSGATDRVVNQLLTEIDGVEGLDGVFIVATTSRIHAIDAALLRPGRIATKVLVDFPNLTDRKELFAHFANKLKIKPPSDNIIQLSQGLSCADIEMLCLEVAMQQTLNISERIIQLLSRSQFHETSSAVSARAAFK